MPLSFLVDALCADIGSTKTMVSALTGLDQPQPLLQGPGVSITTIAEGDVCIGLNHAIEDLRDKLNVSTLSWKTLMATCSAAGGLRMAVHGLVKSMTARAAKEAALGAGAILVSITDGLLSDKDLKDLLKQSPKILLLAGGIDEGETEKVLENAKRIVSTHALFSVIFAGNQSIAEEVQKIFSLSNMKLYITENVYPAIDQFNIIPTRNVIHEIFEEHLVESPGMEKIKGLVDGPVLPTPGAVMRASQLLADSIGDLITVDIGGATTDIHSITEGSPEMMAIQINPEPISKRTVEGDLGIYINAPHVFKRSDRGTLAQQGNKDLPDPLPLFPKTKEETLFLKGLTKTALSIALLRHVGKKKKILTYKGEREVVEGKDLTSVKWVIGTGGALTRLEGGMEILRDAFRINSPELLLPTHGIQFLIDRHYTMAAAGLISLKFPGAALKLMKNSLGIS